MALKKFRAGTTLRVVLLDGLRSYAGFGIREETVDTMAVFELASETSLSAYDASYLWLARAARLPLVTLDSGLAAAAARSA